MRHSRRRLAVLGVMVGLAGAVAVHHGMPMDMDAMPGHVICLAVLGGVALLAAGVVPIAVLRLFPRVVHVAERRSLVVMSPRSVPARAGPLYLRLSVLRL